MTQQPSEGSVSTSNLSSGSDTSLEDFLMDGCIACLDSNKMASKCDKCEKVYLCWQCKMKREKKRCVGTVKLIAGRKSTFGKRRKVPTSNFGFGRSRSRS